MIFNLFGSKKHPESDSKIIDYVFAGNLSKINALIILAKENPATIFIAWFADTAKLSKEIFTQNGLDENKIFEARNIHAVMLQQHQPVFIEHHPLLQKELSFIDKFQVQKISVYSSLEEPLFKHFGSEKIIPIIKLLGMKENEPIVHSMVSKSIAGAQQKIAEKVLVEQSADSQEEWLEKNLKE